ncbi:MAG: hypothetical protein H0U74_19965 [Bradymonadaceae bacterium]|nr:hypothetical protein [Lujinxingiaceae bacterium]
MIGKFEISFVDGLFWKTLLVGSAIALVSALVISTHFAGSVLLGVLVSSLNMRVVCFAGRKMVETSAEGQSATAFWSVILGIKLILLMILTYYFVIVLGANVFGFVIGYSVFLIAILWQSILYVSKLSQEPDSESTDGIQDADIQ